MLAAARSLFATRSDRTLLRQVRRIILAFIAIACCAGVATAADGAVATGAANEEALLHETINIRKSIAVDPGKAWAAIRGIGGLDRWFPVIATCRVEAAGVGATRILVETEWCGDAGQNS